MLRNTSAAEMISFSSEVYRVLIVEDQDSICKALRRLLGEQAIFQLCGEAKNGYEAVERVVELKPEIVVMDISMPGLDGLEATRRIHRLLPEVEILIFTQYESLQAAQAAKDAGARGFLCKSDAAHQLLSALTAVCQHKPFFPHSP